MQNNYKLLIVDDDKEIISSLSLTITNHYPNFKITAASDANFAKDIIFKEKPDIILIDLKLPHIDGFNLIKSLREDIETKDTYLVAMTGYDSEETIEKAFEAGTDDFVSKPFKIYELISKIKSALRVIDLQKKLTNENEKLKSLTLELENDVNNLKKLSVKLIQARNPVYEKIINSTTKAALWIADNCEKISENDKKDLEIASFLCYAGKMFLPDNQLNLPTMTNGIPTNDFMYLVPKNSYEILSSVESFKSAALILKSLYENFDGSGIPDKLQSWQIPLTSRILRVCIDYFEFIYINDIQNSVALEEISKNAGRLYDKRIITLFEQFVFLNNDINNQNYRAIKITNLEPGMELALDIITQAGFKLVAKDTILNEGIIQKIIQHNTYDPILGYFMIKKSG